MARPNEDRFTDDDDALLGELGVEAEAAGPATYTARQERIIAGFEDVQRFARGHGRPPLHGEGLDIFERLYAVRLDRIRGSPECVELLRPFDAGGLLGACVEAALPEDLTDEALLGALGVDAAPDDITVLRHVRPDAARQSPDEVAQRVPCRDFERLRPLFAEVQAELASGGRRTVEFKGRDNQKIGRGDWYILDGQKALVAEAGKEFKADHGERDRRLRVVFDNGTESDLLMRSLRRALNKDEHSRRILPPDADVGPLFSDQAGEDDMAAGTIYVARSLSDHPFVREHRDVLHKIGVTGGDASARVAGAKKDPTFLLAEAEIVATYRLANVNRLKLEHLLQRFFAAVRMDVRLADRFGTGVTPQEWFLVPLPVIAEAVRRVTEGTIGRFRYDPDSASIVQDHPVGGG